MNFDNIGTKVVELQYFNDTNLDFDTKNKAQ